MSSAPCPFLGKGSLNTFPQKQTRGTIDLSVGNGAVKRFYQQYRLCFPWGPCKVDKRESSSEAGSWGRTGMTNEGTQRSTTEYKGVSLRKEYLTCAVVTVRLL
jgi:hypothetical protein